MDELVKKVKESRAGRERKEQEKKAIR